jgi:NAD(P)-dependent dehydrogenase (short-subunit alcohol dehydrogenase family)
MPLTNQVILVTGAGGGLGGTASLALAEQGATIILLDKNIPKLEAVYDKIVASNASEPIMYPFDLAGASETDYETMAVTITEKFGALHGLLHSAVEFNAYTPLSILATKDWGHTLNVNLNAPFLLTRVLLPVLQKSPFASIVFTSDSSCRNAIAYSGAYGISKIAIEGYAKILAEELEAANKIRVNTIIPGLVDSPQRARAYPAEDKSRLSSMQSLAKLYVYLFTHQSIGTTGQVIDAQTFNG